MNTIPFKVIFLCIFLPPIMYLLSTQAFQKYAQNKRARDLKYILIQDYESLYNGRHNIQNEISTNLDQYFKNDKLRFFGITTSIMVTSKGGDILYPLYFTSRKSEPMTNDNLYSKNDLSFNYVKIAMNNFRILKEGLRVSVEVKLRHNSWFTNSILIFYLSLSTLILYLYYKRRSNDWLKTREDEQNRIDLLTKKMVESENSLKEILKKEEEYINKINGLRQDKKALRSDIVLLKDEVRIQKKKSIETDEILEEMERLEEDVRRNISIKEEKEGEIAELKDEINQLKRIETQGLKRRKKDIDSLNKRFSAIYKNVLFHKRALEGYIVLTQDFQIKAEETIHSLNDDLSVSVKRKFFSKRGKLNIFEVSFSYSGRIYFMKRDDNKIEIIAIGTKNTQEHDIAFIENIT